jgi:hypothetical protein
VIVSGQNTPAISVQWNNVSGSVQVITGNDCGNNPIASVLPVVVNLPPVALNPITGPDTLCINTNATFTTPILGPPDSYSWTVPAGVTINTGQGTNTIDVTWGTAAGTITCMGMNDCGQTPAITKEIAIKTIPDAAATIAGKDTICQGQGDNVYSIPEVTGATQYVWTLPAGVTITSGSGTNQVTLLMDATAQSGNVSVHGLNDCGPGTASVKAIVLKNCTGIDENGLHANVKIFPNPVSGELTIMITGRENKLDLSVSDITGKTLYSETLSSITPDYRKKLDMSGFSKGVYFIKLTSNDRVYSEKVIVQ